MSTASKVLIVAGMINLLIGGFSGIPMALGVGFALTISTVSPWLATTAAWMLAVASGLLVIKDTINWRQGTQGEFAERSLGLRFGTVFGPLHVVGMSLAAVCVFSGL